MSIHQIQLRYEPVADRLLLSVRTRAGELYTAWLTRRMVARLGAPLRQAVARLVLPRTAAAAVALPEAQQMLEQVARERPLKDTDFEQPFAGSEGASHPLGPEPLLPGEIDVQAPPAGGLVIALRELRGRRLDLTLSNDLATALLRLLDRAVEQAEWALPGPATPAEPATPGPQHLN
jgi:hypothetical protein